MPAGNLDLDSIDSTEPRIPPTILIVEDEVIVAEDMRRRLEELGYTVTGVVSRGETALEHAATRRPDLILMDIGIKGNLDGVEVAERVLADMDIPIIFASAYSDDATLRRARKTDPYGFVLKPFDERELRTAIEMGLYKHATERRLRERENMYRSLVELSNDGIATFDLEGRLTFCNSRKVSMLGYGDPSELRGKHALELIVPADHARATRLLTRVLEGKRMDAEVFGLQRRDGSRMDVEISATLIKGLPGESPGIMSIEHDVTRQNRDAEALRETAHELAFVLDSVPDAILLEDGTRHVRFANTAFRRMFGIGDGDDLIGLSCPELARAAGALITDGAGFVARIEALVAASAPVTGDVILLRDGRRLLRNYAPRMMEGRVAGHLWHYRHAP